MAIRPDPQGVIAVYDSRKTHPRPMWYCKQKDCEHASEMLSLALFHQHDEHKVPMYEMDVRTAFIKHRKG